MLQKSTNVVIQLKHLPRNIQQLKHQLGLWFCDHSFATTTDYIPADLVFKALLEELHAQYENACHGSPFDFIYHSLAAYHGHKLIHSEYPDAPNSRELSTKLNAFSAQLALFQSDSTHFSDMASGQLQDWCSQSKNPIFFLQIDPATLLGKALQRYNFLENIPHYTLV